MQNQATEMTGAEQVAWNLDDLVKAPAETGIDDLLEQAERRAEAFGARFRGRVAALEAAQLRELLAEYEWLLEAAGQGGDLRVPVLVHEE